MRRRRCGVRYYDRICCDIIQQSVLQALYLSATMRHQLIMISATLVTQRCLATDYGSSLLLALALALMTGGTRRDSPKPSLVATNTSSVGLQMRAQRSESPSPRGNERGERVSRRRVKM